MEAIELYKEETYKWSIYRMEVKQAMRKVPLSYHYLYSYCTV